MNRFKKAWQALTGRLEPEVVFADNSALVTVYKVTDYGLISELLGYEQDRRYYYTCEQAHTTEPGRSVEAVKLIKISGKLYRFPQDQNLWEVSIQPKPKRAKGTPRG